MIHGFDDKYDVYVYTDDQLPHHIHSSFPPLIACWNLWWMVIALPLYQACLCRSEALFDKEDHLTISSHIYTAWIEPGECLKKILSKQNPRLYIQGLFESLGFTVNIMEFDYLMVEKHLTASSLFTHMHIWFDILPLNWVIGKCNTVSKYELERRTPHFEAHRITFDWFNFFPETRTASYSKILQEKMNRKQPNSEDVWTSFKDKCGEKL